MKLLPALLLVTLTALPAAALEMAGVALEPAVTVNNHTIRLNGAGIRKKFFIKVYIGSLYSARRLTSAGEALADRGDKLIRMNFLHSRVEKGKIVEAFREGFANNTPAMAGSVDAKRFLSFFTADFVRGDVVDLVLGSDGSVVVRHNGKVLGSLVSPPLAHAILAIYLGERPADEGLKQGMLGG
ncbi:MAG TPA: chalcone isomerase family protein [Desulfuromonadaceae bacterium]